MQASLPHLWQPLSDIWWWKLKTPNFVPQVMQACERSSGKIDPVMHIALAMLESAANEIRKILPEIASFHKPHQRDQDGGVLGIPCTLHDNH